MKAWMTMQISPDLRLCLATAIILLYGPIP